MLVRTLKKLIEEKPKLNAYGWDFVPGKRGRNGYKAKFVAINKNSKPKGLQIYIKSWPFSHIIYFHFSNNILLEKWNFIKDLMVKLNTLSDAEENDLNIPFEGEYLQ